MKKEQEKRDAEERERIAQDGRAEAVVQYGLPDRNRHSGRLQHRNPEKIAASHKVKLELLRNSLLHYLNMVTSTNRERVRSAQAVLRAMDPHSVLQRGFSITRTVPHGKVVTDARSVHLGQPLEIQLAKGQIAVTVQEDTKSPVEE